MHLHGFEQIVIAKDGEPLDHPVRRRHGPRRSGRALHGDLQHQRTRDMGLALPYPQPRGVVGGHVRHGHGGRGRGGRLTDSREADDLHPALPGVPVARFLPHRLTSFPSTGSTTGRASSLGNIALEIMATPTHPGVHLHRRLRDPDDHRPLRRAHRRHAGRRRRTAAPICWQRSIPTRPDAGRADDSLHERSCGCRTSRTSPGARRDRQLPPPA